jgi:hypothetical protein
MQEGGKRVFSPPSYASVGDSTPHQWRERGEAIRFSQQLENDFERHLDRARGTITVDMTEG